MRSRRRSIAPFPTESISIFVTGGVPGTDHSHNTSMKIAKYTLSLMCAVLAGCQPDSPSGVAPELVVPAAAGAMAPNLATGSDGTVVLSWIEPSAKGHVLRYSTLGPGGWEEPGTVAGGDNWFVNWADFPSVVPLSDSMWAAHWLQSQPAGGYAYDVKVSLSDDGGATWAEPFMPHTDGTPTEHGFVTLFPDAGGLGLVWLDGRKMVNEFDRNDITASGMTLRAATFGADQLPIRESLVDGLICDCCQTDVALTRTGPVAVYRDRTVDEVRDIYVSRRVYGEWQEGIPVAADNWEIPACPVNGPIIRARDDDVVVAWFTAANDQPLVKTAWSGDGGQSFGEPVVLNKEAPLGHIGAELMPDGSFVVAWHRREGNGEASLVARRLSPSGKLSDVLVIEEASDIFAFSVPQVARADDALVLAWTNEVNDAYSIGSTLIPLTRFTTQR